MKKGQMEIVGLMLIVIIVGLAMAFGLVYMNSNKAPKQIHQSFGERGISANFVTVLSKIDVPQCRTDYSTLVKDCVKNFEPSAIESGTIECTDSRMSCYHINRTVSKILNSTLDKWGISYRFLIEMEGLDRPILEKSTFGCDENSPKEAPGRQPIPLFPLPKEAYIVLEVCR